MLLFIRYYISYRRRLVCPYVVLSPVGNFSVLNKKNNILCKMSSTYSQQGGKRQKVREGRVDYVDYFQGIDKVEYNNMASVTDTTNYRYYNNSERLHSRSMEEWMKCSISLTEFRSYGTHHERPTHNRPWDDGTNSLDNHKRCIKALSDLSLKLGIRYWTAFDTDLVPAVDSLDENRGHWDEIVEFIQELSQRSHFKLLWLAPDLHSHPRYTSGAFTTNDASTFAQAASQIKKCLEISQRLNAECFLIYPYREGYDAIFKTDIPREIKLFSKLLKISVEYKEKLNYRCQMLIMPYTNNPGDYKSMGLKSIYWRESELIHRYMWDITSCLYFLKSNNLDRYYKVCTPPGHHMYMGNMYNALGGVTITDEYDDMDSRRLTLMMKCIIDQGSAPVGGVHLQLSPRRTGDPRALLTGYVRYIDSIARALRAAATLVAEQIFSKHTQQRYVSYYSGFGARLANNDVTMEECEEYYKKNQPHNELTSSKREHLEIVFQRYVDSSDHV